MIRQKKTLAEAEEAMPQFQAVLREAIGVAEDILIEGIQSRYDHYAGQVGAMLFLGQLFHGRAVLALDTQRSAALIARSMYEGDLYLRWFGQEDSKLEERCKAYLAHCYVLDFYKMQDRLKKGQLVPEEDQRAIQSGLAKHEDLILSKKAREAKKSGQPLPAEPYVSKIVPPVRSLCEQFGIPEFYSHYQMMSDLAHWSPAGLALLWVSPEPHRRSFVSQDLKWSCWCLAFANLSLLDAMLFVDKVLFGGKRATVIQGLYQKLPGLWNAEATLSAAGLD